MSGAAPPPVEVPPWVDREQYPFTPRGFDTPEGRLAYLDEGSGAPLVMVHGNPVWSFVYRAQVRALAPGFRAVVPDLLGFGLSDTPPSPLSPAQHAQHLESLLDALELDGITFVVQDWGGPIGLDVASRNPQRVARLVILNTWAWSVRRDWYYQAFSRFMGGPLGRFLIARRNTFVESVMPAAYSQRSRLTPGIHDHYRNALATRERRACCARLPREIISSSGWLDGIEHRLGSLADKPVDIVWGLGDVAFRRKELERWRRIFPRAHVQELVDAGHWVQEEAPEVLNGVIAAGADRS